MEKRDKKDLKVKLDLLAHRELKLGNQALQGWTDSMVKRVNQDFGVTLEETVSKEARENQEKVDSPVLLESLELMEALVQQDHVVVQEIPVRMVLLAFLDYQVWTDLKEPQVSQDDPDFKATMENQEEVSKEHLARTDFKDDLVPLVVKVNLDLMVLRENRVCLEDQLKDHQVKMVDKDLPDLLGYLVDKDLKENPVKTQSLTKTSSLTLHSLVQRDHQDLRVLLDSLVILVCQV